MLPIYTQTARRSRPARTLLTTLLLLVGLVGVSLLLGVTPASALDCGGVDTSVIGGEACEGASTTSTDSANNPVISVLKFVMQVLMGAVGIAAVGALIYAGIMYSSAGGESSQVQKAKTTIKDTVIGIVAFSFMIIILNFVIPGGVFGQQGVSGGGTVAHTPDEEEDADNPSTIAGACYYKQFASAPGGKFYHRSGSVSYAFENSPEGITYASKHGYDRIDLDIRMTKDNVIVAVHTAKLLGKDAAWAGFTDTTGKIKDRSTTVEELTFAQISKMKHKDGYRIYSLEYLIGIAAKVDIDLFLELKTPKTLKSRLPQIAAMLNKAQVTAVIAGQTTHEGQKAALAYATKLGFWARNITAKTWAKPNKDSAVCQKLEG